MDALLTSKRKTGFTLAEILLAMMVFAIAITTILGLLARSIETTDSILIKDEAISLSSAVDNFMTEIPFDMAFAAANTGAQLYAYQYRVKPQDNGVLSPYPNVNSSDQMGADYTVISGVRFFNDAQLAGDFGAIQGRFFQVQLSISAANPAGVTLPATPETYDSAVIVLYAKFYNVSGVQADATGDPVFTFNFAVRR